MATEPDDEHALDLRALPPPLPMLRAMDVARALAPGASAVVLTPMWPLPLFASLEEQGLRWDARHLPCGGARVQIRRPDGAD
jgi:hypothetical protein